MLGGIGNEAINEVKNWKEHNKTADQMNEDSGSLYKSNQKFLKKIILGRYAGTDKQDKYMKIYKIASVVMAIPILVGSWSVMIMGNVFIGAINFIFKSKARLEYDNNISKILSFIMALIALPVILMYFLKNFVTDPLSTLWVIGLFAMVIGAYIAFVKLSQAGIKKVMSARIDNEDMEERINTYNQEKQNQLQIGHEEKLQIEYKENANKAKQLLLELKNNFTSIKNNFGDEEEIKVEVSGDRYYTIDEEFLISSSNVDMINEQDLKDVEEIYSNLKEYIK